MSQLKKLKPDELKEEFDKCINLQAKVFKKQKITDVPDVTKDESVKREEKFKVQQPILRYNVRKSLARKGLQKNKSKFARSDTKEDVEAYIDERVDEPSSEEFQMGSIPQGSAPAKIVKWQILKTGLLNDLTRDDLKELYILMMLKNRDIRPEEEYERAAHIYMLTEVMYPLSSRVCQFMLEKKLIGDRKDEEAHNEDTQRNLKFTSEDQVRGGLLGIIVNRLKSGSYRVKSVDLDLFKLAIVLQKTKHIQDFGPTFKTDESAPTPRSPQTKVPFAQTRLRRARKTVRLEPPMSPSMEAYIVEYAAAPALPSPPPSPLLPWSPPLPQIPSPPLPPPPSSLHLPPLVPTSLPLPSSPLPPLLVLLFIPPTVNRKENIPEAELPPRKRLCLTAPTSRFIGTTDVKIRHRRAEEVGYGIRDVWVDPIEAVKEVAPTNLEGVNARVTELAAVQEQDTQDVYAVIEDTQDIQTQFHHYRDSYQRHWDRFKQFRLEIRLMQMILRAL
ncbi:hypothetical protein Tco_0495756, partial [Tanacetum coccineum]